MYRKYVIIPHNHGTKKLSCEFDKILPGHATY